MIRLPLCGVVGDLSMLEIHACTYRERKFLLGDPTGCRNGFGIMPAGSGAGMQMRPGDITTLLASWRNGEREALNRLVPLIRTDLHRLARRQLGRERRDHTMQPSSLVQEAFVRLLPGADQGWQNRAHFFAVASTVMRHVLVDYARQRLGTKRGGGAAHIPLDAAVVLSPEQIDRIVAVDLALQRLAETDARKSRVFEMRYFGGLTVEEAAEALGVAPNTVIRDWSFARAWLRRELGTKTTDSE